MVSNWSKGSSEGRGDVCRSVYIFFKARELEQLDDTVVVARGQLHGVRGQVGAVYKVLAVVHWPDTDDLGAKNAKKEENRPRFKVRTWTLRLLGQGEWRVSLPGPLVPFDLVMNVRFFDLVALRRLVVDGAVVGCSHLLNETVVKYFCFSGSSAQYQWMLTLT